MSGLVSVIIPVYNMKNFIKNCVDSVLSQTYKNIEIILVNDGSEDNSLSVCKAIAKDNSNIVLIDQQNQGVSVARNVGIEVAKGDFLTFLDADDTLNPQALEKLVSSAQKYDSDITIGKIHENEKIQSGILEDKDFLVKILEDNPVGYYSCRILYKRTFVKDIRFPEGFGCGEDSYFVFECALKKPKAVVIEDHVYNYYVNENSATHSCFTDKRYKDICELLSKKEKTISVYYPEYLSLFYHLKTKIQMMILSNLCFYKGPENHRKEKETLKCFDEVKEYFRPELPCSNVSFYRVLSKGMYYPYKCYSRFRKMIKSILRR